MARLLFHRGDPNDGPPLFVMRLRPTRTKIGRVDECDVVLPDEGVSRTHCLVDARDDGWVLIDRSTNGTFVNDARIERHLLQEHDRVKVGPFVAVFTASDGNPPPPTEEQQPWARDEAILDGLDRLEVADPWLTIVSGPGEGRSLRLRGSRIPVGGAGTARGGLTLQDPALVRDHTCLRLYNGRTMVEPGQGAAFVGEHRVRDVLPLLPNEEVRIGATQFVVEWRSSKDAPQADKFGEMVGRSVAMRQAFGMLRRMSAHLAPILLIGESGTGKELAARAIHEASPRVGKAFVPLNCGAITATLFESELFGHEKGAFTGAAEKRDGAFQRADNGTLFLDEVGELPEEAQSKLLRALESGEVRRVGGGQATFPDVRIVAATNRNLADMVREKAFRADLYFRLAVLAVRLPPLRERPEDVALLAETIAARLDPNVQITPDAMELLRHYDWPGNARELRNVLTRAFVMGGPRIEASSIVLNPLGASVGTDRVRAPAVARASLEDAERDVVMDALRRNGGNRSHAARELGVARSTLLYKLRKWGEE